jgi:hypothetical protein
MYCMYAYVCIYVSMLALFYACMYVCMDVCVYVYLFFSMFYQEQKQSNYAKKNNPPATCLSPASVHTGKWSGCHTVSSKRCGTCPASPT